MKLISALNSQHIQESMKNNYPDLEFILPDLSYQEGVMDALKQYTIDALILNLDIEGDLDKYAFIETIRQMLDTLKIVLIIKTEDKEYQNWLITRGVFDVFIDGQCTFDEIYESLCREQKVIIKKEVRKDQVVKERVITKEKIVKEVVSVNFRKLILSVWGCSEFACEFAYAIAKLSNHKVLLIDLDFVSPKADIYLGLAGVIQNLARDSPDSSSIDRLLESHKNGALTMESFERCSIMRKELHNLFILTSKPEMNLTEQNTSELLGHAYRLFDIVVVILNNSIYDAMALAALLRADYNIAAFPATADYMRDFENYLLYMNAKHNLPLDRIRYVAYEYKDKIQLPVGYLKEMFPGESFLGVIEHNRQRELYRNLNSCYARWTIKKNPEEYIKILSKFNIVPKRTIKEKLRKWFSRRIRSVTKFAVKNRLKPIAKNMDTKEAI